MSKTAWLILLTLLILPGTTGCGWLFPQDKPYSPDQPIAFDHKVHVTDFDIQCLYCHTYANRSPFAGVPSVERCMGCHLIVAAQTEGVQALNNYWQRGEPIPWIKVNVLPRFVHFNHEAHVRAEVDCAECHGDVKSMSKISQTSSLKMGWCLECHLQKEASVDCLTCHY
ncbi:MAG: cytochrome c3 family protein [Acidobacteriota bacterium]